MKDIGQRACNWPVPVCCQLLTVVLLALLFSFAAGALNMSQYLQAGNASVPCIAIPTTCAAAFLDAPLPVEGCQLFLARLVGCVVWYACCTVQMYSMCISYCGAKLHGWRAMRCQQLPLGVAAAASCVCAAAGYHCRMPGCMCVLCCSLCRCVWLVLPCILQCMRCLAA